MAVSVTTTNLIQGPAVVYVAPFGSTEPVTTAGLIDPTTPWTNVGATSGGLTVTLANSYTDMAVDQIVDPAGSRMTGRAVTVSTSLAEVTLANLKLAMNGGTVAAGTAPAPNTYTPDYDVATIALPVYSSLIVDGQAPGDGTLLRRFIVRKVLSNASVGMAFAKDGQTLIPVTFQAYYVSNSIAPFVVQETPYPS